MLKESQSHCSVAICMHPVSNVAGTETDGLENSYYDWEEQRREMNNEPKCQVCYSEQAYSDYSTQSTYSVLCHVLIFLHLQSLNPGAECWPVKEVFCFLSVKKMNVMHWNHMANLFSMFLKCVLVFLPSVMVREVSFQPNLSPPTRCANMPLRKQNHWNGMGEG